jgi:hypothetical protein
MGTMRPDRDNLPREQQTMADTTIFKQSYNIESFSNMCSTRMCYGQVSKETLSLIKDIIKHVYDIEPEVLQYCVPPCIKYWGCKEKKLRRIMHLPKCEVFSSFVQLAYKSSIEIGNLEERFKFYFRRYFQ